MYLTERFWALVITSQGIVSPSPAQDVKDIQSPLALQSEYYLMTQVINGGSSDKDGLYVSAYHTGMSTFLPEPLRVSMDCVPWYSLSPMKYHSVHTQGKDKRLTRGPTQAPG